MDSDAPGTERVLAAARRLGNPYAVEAMLGDQQLVEAGDQESLTPAEWAYVRELQDPYAYLAVAGAHRHGSASARSDANEGRAAASDQRVSKHDFEAGCRAIFRQYIPTREKGRLRQHHKDFIARNRVRSPQARARLLNELRKYDLSDLLAFQGHYNREREALTSAKLEEIERIVLANFPHQ